MRLKTSLVHLTQSKGRVCQGCDVYVGPKVNNSEWISLQSLWSNPFDSDDLTPMRHNEMYSRHIDHNTVSQKFPLQACWKMLRMSMF